MAKKADETNNANEAKVTGVQKAPIKKGMLFSRLSYAVTVRYKNQNLVVTPRAKLKLENYDQLDMTSLPKGVTARPIK